MLSSLPNVAQLCLFEPCHSPSNSLDGFMKKTETLLCSELRLFLASCYLREYCLLFYHLYCLA